MREVCAALDRYFEYYSRPSRVITDRGSCFTSLEFSSYLLDRNIIQVKVAVHSPQANVQVERVNRVLIGMLGKLSEPLQHSDWVGTLTQIEYALNNTVHRSIRTTPSKLLFGVSQRAPIIDKLTEFLEEKELNHQERELNKLRENASKAILKVQEYNTRYFGEHNNPAPTFRAGNYVVTKNVDTTPGSNKKLIPKFKGPYGVHRVLPNDRYAIRDIENCQITKIPYDGVDEATHVRMWKDDDL